MAGAIESFLKPVHDLVTADAALKAFFPKSTVKLYFARAPEDEAPPYIAHRLQGNLDPLMATSYHHGATYLVDVWDHDQTAERCADMLARVIALLDDYEFDPDDGVTDGCRLIAQSSDLLPDPGRPDIWHGIALFQAQLWDLTLAS